jgi:hypothetical protein
VSRAEQGGWGRSLCTGGLYTLRCLNVQGGFERCGRALLLSGVWALHHQRAQGGFERCSRACAPKWCLGPSSSKCRGDLNAAAELCSKPVSGPFIINVQGGFERCCCRACAPKRCLISSSSTFHEPTDKELTDRARIKTPLLPPIFWQVYGGGTVVFRGV